LKALFISQRNDLASNSSLHTLIVIQLSEPLSQAHYTVTLFHIALLYIYIGISADKGL